MYIYIYVYMYIYINTQIYEIMKTMCSHCYHHDSFVALEHVTCAYILLVPLKEE